MKPILILLVFFSFFFEINAQYNPGIFNYGIVAIKGANSVSEIGGGLRVEFAYNCYNTFMVEYNRLFSVASNNENSGYNEVVLGTSLILFNWNPTTVTAGMGYVVNNDSDFKNKVDEANLVFQTESLNHGVQIKLRGLHKLSRSIHVFGEFNLKSLGADYHNFLIGLNYEFNARR